MNRKNIPAYWHVIFVYLAVVAIQIVIIINRGEILQSDTDLLLIYSGVMFVIIIKLVLFPADRH